MPYKISGNLVQTVRLVLIDQNDWTIKHDQTHSPGNFEVAGLGGNQYLMLGCLPDGQSVGFGNVSAEGFTGDRGVFAGGNNWAYTQYNIMEYITISTTGDAQDFGDVRSNRYNRPGGTSNGYNDRGVFGGGNGGISTIDYIPISVLGNSVAFGSLTATRYNLGAVSNGTNDRAVFSSGYNKNVLDYVTISTTGNATDFGDNLAHRWAMGCTSNDTGDRGIFAGGTGAYASRIDYITISSTGNTSYFGNLTSSRDFGASTSNGINNRGITAGDHNFQPENIIDYITISTTGNATNFGDMTVKRGLLEALSNKTNDRGIFAGGYQRDGAGDLNIIDYVTISTTGNATNFGDLSVKRGMFARMANA